MGAKFHVYSEYNFAVGRAVIQKQQTVSQST